MEVFILKNAKDIPMLNLPPLSVAIGFFDGIHLGHQEVIHTAKKFGEMEGLKTGVITFDPSPKAVLGKNPEEVKYITLFEDKKEILAQMGIDYMFVIPFTRELASHLPEDFVKMYLIPLNVKHVTAGFDFTYGKFGKGNMDTLQEHGKGHFTVTKVEKVEKGEEKISSTLIRTLIQEGKNDFVPQYLGRHYTMKGLVVHGEKRGRELGYPTANIEVDQRYVQPKLGIYTVRLYVQGKWHNGVASFGYNPTFQKEKEHLYLEVHLIDFDGDIYGEKVILEWHTRLRGEMSFNSVEELIDQIGKDKEEAIHYFANRGE